MAEEKDVLLALKWAKNILEGLENTKKLVGEYPTAEEIRALFGLDMSIPFERAKNAIMKYPEFYRTVNYTRTVSPELFKDTLDDLDTASNIEIWSRNKQVYSFDSDFLDELMNTDTLMTVKDGWDYLPYNNFYIDISSNKGLSDKLGKGFFIHLEKGLFPRDNQMCDCYMVHICRVNDTYFYSDVLCRENITTEIAIDREIKEDIKVFDLPKSLAECEKMDLLNIDTHTEKLETGLYDALIFQILTYLSSVEPDIKENATTKQTYRKPNPNMKPKHKFSEVQKWNVGNDFGVSYRKWKAEKKSSQSSSESRIGNGAGTKKRPHSRKAHWSHYWYGSGENKVRRPKWIASTFINIGNNEEKGVTVTKVLKNA